MNRISRPNAASLIPASAAPVPAFFTLVSLQQLDTILSIVLTLAAIVIVAALALAFWRELANDTVVIAPIAVPRDLAERGYEAQVVAARGRRTRRAASRWTHVDAGDRALLAASLRPARA